MSFINQRLQLIRSSTTAARCKKICHVVPESYESMIKYSVTNIYIWLKLIWNKKVPKACIIWMFLDSHYLNSIIAKSFDAWKYIISKIGVRVNLWLLHLIDDNIVRRKKHIKQNSKNWITQGRLWPLFPYIDNLNIPKFNKILQPY